MNIARFTSRPAQLPTAQEARLAADSARLLATSIGDGEIATLRVNDTDPGIALPSSALRMPVAILAQMGRGHAVTVVSLPPSSPLRRRRMSSASHNPPWSSCWRPATYRSRPSAPLGA